MTRDETMALEAGRELDALIENKVMGNAHDWANCRWCQDPGRDSWNPHIPRYSKDIAAVWHVVEKIAVEPLAFHLETTNMPGGPIYWALFWGDNLNTGGIDEYAAEASTAPLAICRAALLAVTP